MKNTMPGSHTLIKVHDLKGCKTPEQLERALFRTLWESRDRKQVTDGKKGKK